MHSTANMSSTATANMPTKMFTSTPARATDRCCDRGSHLIEASQKISSHSISERSNFDESYCGNQGEKRSNTLSKRLCEINKVLHKSVLLIDALPVEFDEIFERAEVGRIVTGGSGIFDMIKGEFVLSCGCHSCSC